MLNGMKINDAEFVLCYMIEKIIEKKYFILHTIEKIFIKNI
jgi:hypothetical protein